MEEYEIKRFIIEGEYKMGMLIPAAMSEMQENIIFLYVAKDVIESVYIVDTSGIPMNRYLLTNDYIAAKEGMTAKELLESIKKELIWRFS